jgi:UDP-N-acetyl-D-glucosamine dehydrogenase
MGLKERFADGSAVLGVVGLGYVGLPLVVEMAKAGFSVVGFDVSDEKIALVNAGESYIPDVAATEFAALVAKGLVSGTTDFARASECDAIAICVPTPLDEMKEPDTSFMEDAARSIAPHLKAGALVTLESTTYPGTTEEIVQPILEAGGRKVGTDLHLAFSPERVDPGNVKFQTKNTPKVVGGVTAECTDMAVAMYERFIDTVVPVSTTRAAEMTKLLENIFRCVNIALMNELLVVSERMGIDIWEVVEAAKTKPFGFMPFYPGPGLGGHCIPIDPFYVVSRLMDALNSHHKPLAGSTVLVLGVAYKANIDDMRESPAIKITELLLAKGAKLVYHDPHVPEYRAGGVSMTSAALTPELVGGADAVLVVTDHTGVDYGMVARELVLDTRNALNAFRDDKVVRL